MAESARWLSNVSSSVSSSNRARVRHVQVLDRRAQALAFVEQGLPEALGVHASSISRVPSPSRVVRRPGGGPGWSRHAHPRARPRGGRAREARNARNSARTSVSSVRRRRISSRVRSCSDSAVAAISRAFARASSTIRSASRWALARSSSAIRSAESSVLRSASSISRWRAQLALEPLHLVTQVGAVAPDVLEARGDVRQEPVDAGTLVAQGTPRQGDVPNFDRGQRHGPKLRRAEPDPCPGQSLARPESISR